MRRALAPTLIALGAAACGGYGYEARTTTITGAPMITSGPMAGEAELPRDLSSTSRALALEACRHERRCGRGTITACMDATAERARQELASWTCDPAETRARYEECLVNFDALSCEVQLQSEPRPLCPRTLGCGGNQARLIPVGRELTKIWE